jgi:hypothetical protein
LFGNILTILQDISNLACVALSSPKRMPVLKYLLERTEAPILDINALDNDDCPIVFQVVTCHSNHNRKIMDFLFSIPTFNVNIADKVRGFRWMFFLF